MAEPAAHNDQVAGSSPAGPTTSDEPGRRRREAHVWDRHPRDWYVEPAWCTQALLRDGFHDGYWENPLWDPAAGMGTIVKTAREMGFEANGSDIEPRDPEIQRWDFFQTPPEPQGLTIISNPPFKCAEQFVQHALLCSKRTVMLLPAGWVQGETRARWLRTTPLRRVRFICPRPSMPPGEVVLAGEKPGNGSRDYAWFIWEAAYEGRPEIAWCMRDP